MNRAPLVAKNILMIAYTYYESDPRVIREAEAAISGGFSVDFLSLRRPGTLPTEVVRGVHVFRLDQARYRGGGRISYIFEYLKFFVRCFVATTSLYVKNRYSIIHVNNMPDFMVFCTLVPKLFGAKIILDIHDPMPNTFASKFKTREGGLVYSMLLCQERLSAAYSNRVITVHDPVKDGILVKHGLPADSITVIANFADGDLFPLRTEYSVQGKIRFVFHGTILERSGLRLIIDALVQMKHKERISVKIIGDGDFSLTLKDLIKSRDLESVVEFDNSSYPVAVVSKVISDCHVGLVPLEISSVTDYAVPLKLLEYISLGLPVVSVRNKAIFYYFDEEDCMFFDWTDPSSLSTIFDRIAESPEILLKYRLRAVSIRDRFLWAGERRKYLDLLRSLITGMAEGPEVVRSEPVRH